MDILSAKPRIECLQFVAPLCLQPVDQQHIQQRFKHLRGIHLVHHFGSDKMCEAMATALSEQLQSLHITALSTLPLPSLSDATTHFNNLEELCLSGVRYALASNVLKTSSKLILVH